jgi:hypothetical protein
MNLKEEGTTLKKQRSIACIFTLGTLALLLSSSTALGNSFAETYGFSTKGMAMGNAMTAIVDDWSSLYYNIAGLGRTAHMRTLRTPEDGGEEIEEFFPSEIALNYMYTAPQFHLNIPQRYYTNSLDETHVYTDTNAAKGLDFHAVALGFTVDLNKIVKLPDLVSSARFGMALAFANLAFAMKVNDVDLRSHNFMRYGREAQKLIIDAGAALGFLEDLYAFGLGFNLSSFHGQTMSVISNGDIGPVRQYPLQQTKMDLQIVPSFLAGFYTNIKRIGGSHFNLSVGVSYRQQSYFEVQPFTVRNILNAGGVDMIFDLAIFDYYSPHTINVGVAVSTERLTLSAEADFELWSKFRTSRSLREALAKMGYYIPTMLDIVVPRVGFKAKVFDWMDLMAGYYFQPTFVPNWATRGVFNILDNNRHVVSFGARIGLPRLDFLGGPADFTIGCQFQILEGRYVVKTDDPNNTMNPNYNYGGWNPTISAELSMKL